MSAHHTSISDAMITTAARLAGASVLDVRRAVLGMPTDDVDRRRIVDALVSLGADRPFLEHVATFGKPLYVPNARTTGTDTKPKGTDR